MLVEIRGDRTGVWHRAGGEEAERSGVILGKVIGGTPRSPLLRELRRGCRVLGSALVPIAGEGVPPSRTSLMLREQIACIGRRSSFPRDAETSTRDECAPRRMTFALTKWNLCGAWSRLQFALLRPQVLTPRPEGTRGRGGRAHLQSARRATRPRPLPGSRRRR